jgi:hypothetical protein
LILQWKEEFGRWNAQFSESKDVNMNLTRSQTKKFVI